MTNKEIEVICNGGPYIDKVRERRNIPAKKKLQELLFLLTLPNTTIIGFEAYKTYLQSA